VVTATTARVTAADDGTIVAISGNVGIAENVGAVGAAGSRNQVADQATATTPGATVNASTVELLAGTATGITAVSVGGAFADNVAAGGAVSLNDIGNTIDACVCGTATVGGGTLRVTARDTSS